MFALMIVTLSVCSVSTLFNIMSLIEAVARDNADEVIIGSFNLACYALVIVTISIWLGK